MKVNGTELEVKDGTKVSEFLLEQGYEIAKSAVLLNGKVVPRAKLEALSLSNSDEMEIVSFVGGG